jgi:hypothetical protein
MEKKPKMKGPSKASNLKSYKFMPSKEYVAPKPAKKAVASKPVVSKPVKKLAASKTMRKINLPEVTVTATRIKKSAPSVATKQERVRLLPKGEVNKKSVDSLRNIYGERMIPKEVKRREGEVAFMGPDASDRVKRLMKKSK